MDVEKRARHRDKTDVFAEESEALDQIAKQVRKYQLSSSQGASRSANVGC